MIRRWWVVKFITGRTVGARSQLYEGGVYRKVNSVFSGDTCFNYFKYNSPKTPLMKSTTNVMFIISYIFTAITALRRRFVDSSCTYFNFFFFFSFYNRSSRFVQSYLRVLKIVGTRLCLPAFMERKDPRTE